MLFTGYNAYVVAEFNKHLDEEIGIGTSIKGRLYGCGCFFGVVGLGTLIVATIEANSSLALFGMIPLAIGAVVVFLDQVFR